MKLSADSVWARTLLRAIGLRNGLRIEFGEEYIDIIKRNQVIRLSNQHAAYFADMVHSFDYYFTPVFPETEGGREVVDYSRPRLHKYRDTGLEFELTSLPEETSALEGYFKWYRPEAGDIVFDAGAYCGITAYHFSKMVGESGHVFAFEPDVKNYPALKRNIERHRLSNVTAIQLGLAGKIGTAAFHSEGALGSGLAQSANRPSAGTIEQIETISLEEACRRFSVPAFAKVDIEGAEIEMLEGAREFLRSHAIQFAFDTNHTVDGALTASAVEKIMMQCGYETTSSASVGFMTTWARKLDRV
jgi:FkbM family methyltransferase